MASKLFLDSTLLLLLLLLLSNIAIANASIFRTQDLKNLHRKGLNNHEEARVGAPARSHVVNNTPNLFSAHHKRTRIPHSGPSKRHNELKQCATCVKSASPDNEVSNKKPRRNQGRSVL